MAIRNDFAPGEVLAAADLNDTFGSKLPYSFGTATPTTTESGFLWYDSNSTPAAPKFWTGSAFQALTSGKILQVVRATDATDRTTSSAFATYVDASISVTITPQKSDSAVLLIWSASVLTATNNYVALRIADSSNNAISGAERQFFGDGASTSQNIGATIIGYATPATISAVTYKGRFAVNGGGSATLSNSGNTGQLFAIEVSA
jgi:hypothetical protein